MDSQTHKAHRPAQSGAKADKKKSAKGKGKEKQHGFNEKVRFNLLLLLTGLHSLSRHSPPSPVAGQTDRVVAPLSATRLVFTSLSSTALPMTNLLLPSWPSLAPQAWARPLS